MNNTITEIKSTLEGTNSGITKAEDRISEVKDRMVETNEAERKEEKSIKRNEGGAARLRHPLTHRRRVALGPSPASSFPGEPL